MSMKNPLDGRAGSGLDAPVTARPSRAEDVRVWRSTGYRLVLSAFGLLVAWSYFQQLATLLLVLLLTVILALPLSALADSLQRRRVPRAVSVIVAMFALLAVLAAFLAWVAPIAVQQARDFVLQIPASAAELRALIRERLGVAPADFGTPIRDYVLNVFAAPQALVSAGVTVAQLLGGLLLMVFTAIYIALRPGPLVDGFLRLVEPRRRDEARTILERLRDRWLGWLRGSACILRWPPSGWC